MDNKTNKAKKSKNPLFKLSSKRLLKELSSENVSNSLIKLFRPKYVYLVSVEWPDHEVAVSGVFSNTTSANKRLLKLRKEYKEYGDIDVEIHKMKLLGTEKL